MSVPRLMLSSHPLRQGWRERLLAHWFSSTLGQAVLARERALCEQLLPDMFGYHLLQVGGNGDRSLCESSPIRHRMIVASASAPDMLADPAELPVANDALDVVVLHHALDFADSPQRVLREAARVLIPGGKLIVIGFNPWSLWGGMRVVLPRSAQPPWSARFLSPLRVSDWASLLDLQVAGVESAFHGLPSAAPWAARINAALDYAGARGGPQWGAVYVLVAMKQVSRVTPVLPQVRRPRRPLLAPVPLKGGISASVPRKEWMKKHDD